MRNLLTYVEARIIFYYNFPDHLFCGMMREKDDMSFLWLEHMSVELHQMGPLKDAIHTVLQLHCQEAPNGVQQPL